MTESIQFLLYPLEQFGAMAYINLLLQTLRAGCFVKVLKLTTPAPVLLHPSMGSTGSSSEALIQAGIKLVEHSKTSCLGCEGSGRCGVSLELIDVGFPPQVGFKLSKVLGARGRHSAVAKAGMMGEPTTLEPCLCWS